MRSSALRRGLFAWCNDVILIVGVVTPVRLRQACSTHTPGRCLFLPPQPVHTKPHVYRICCSARWAGEKSCIGGHFSTQRGEWEWGAPE